MMKCPRCMRPVDHEAESCYSCGYSELEASSKYGLNQVVLSRVHDAAACLRKQERDDLGAALDQLEVKFPQMLFCAYLGNLPHDLSLSEFGFWLLNHGQVKGAEYTRPNENAILLVIDVNTSQIGISLGYFSETLISEDDAYRALIYGRPDLINGEFGTALERIFFRLARTLRRKGRELKKLSQEELLSYSRRLHTIPLNLPHHLQPAPTVEKERQPSLKSA